jgi:electron transport complex protein RnfE
MSTPLRQEFTKGLSRSNPVFGLLLGLCPTLAVSSSVHNALGMAIAATFVLVCSNVIISLTRDFVPSKVRIPCFIVVIATFVTMVELVMQAYVPPLYKSLGIFVPLIVVNCIILGRAEAFASKNGVVASLLDGLGMGLGFSCAVVLLATIREILGNGTFLGYGLIPGFKPALIMILPPGAFLTLGLILGWINWRRQRREQPHAGRRTLLDIRARTGHDRGVLRTERGRGGE